MSVAGLKWTALILMVIDHLGEFFPQSIPLWFRWLGRLSAPLFLFCLAKGLEKTRSRKKYLKRLWIGSAVMGTGNFLLMLSFPAAPVKISNNIFSTMVLIATCIWIIESFRDNSMREDRLKNPKGALIIFAAAQVISFIVCGAAMQFGISLENLICGFLPNFFYCEGGIGVVLLGLILYYWGKEPKKLCLSYGIYSGLEFLSSFLLAVQFQIYGAIFQYFYQWMMIFSLPFMLSYNGQKGKGGKAVSRFFYIFYPLHIWLFFLLSAVGRL